MRKPRLPARRARLGRAFPSGKSTFVITSEPNNPEATDIYGELLNEAARRCDVVLGFINKSIPLYETLAVEICYLQLRNVCELIALACVSAHGDIAEVKGKKLQGTYQADQIIRHLSRLNAGFYPIPVKRNPDGSIETLEDSPHLTKDELIKLYHICSDYLHVGPFDKLFVGGRMDYSFDIIEQYHRKIVSLLDHSIILLANERYAVENIITRYPNGRIAAQLTGIARFRRIEVTEEPDPL